MTNNDLQSILDQVLSTGKDYLEKGQDIAEEQLNIPQDEAQRELMLDGLKKGALASAILVGLLGTRGGRKLTGTAIKLGGLAALGTLAYKGYQSWAATHGSQDEVTPVQSLGDKAAHQRSLLLVNALVAAANADGKVDDAEQQDIKHQILEMHLTEDVVQELEAIVASPMSVDDLAKAVPDLEAASEIYLVSRMFIGKNSKVTERLYLDQLTEALGLDKGLIDSLEAELAKVA